MINVDKLASKIEEKIKKDFDVLFITGNLRDTIKVAKVEDGYDITIPALRYDLKKWNKEKAIVYTNNGSYASAVDIYGGFSKKHKKYVERAIYEAIAEWLKEEGLEGSVKEDG